MVHTVTVAMQSDIRSYINNAANGVISSGNAHMFCYVLHVPTMHCGTMKAKELNVLATWFKPRAEYTVPLGPSCYRPGTRDESGSRNTKGWQQGMR